MNCLWCYIYHPWGLFLAHWERVENIPLLFGKWRSIHWCSRKLSNLSFLLTGWREQNLPRLASAFWGWDETPGQPIGTFWCYHAVSETWRRRQNGVFDSLVLWREQEDGPVLSGFTPVRPVHLQHLLDAEAQALWWRKKRGQSPYLVHDAWFMSEETTHRNAKRKPAVWTLCFKLFTNGKPFYSNSSEHLPTLPSASLSPPLSK